MVQSLRPTCINGKEKNVMTVIDRQRVGLEYATVPSFHHKRKSYFIPIFIFFALTTPSTVPTMTHHARAP